VQAGKPELEDNYQRKEVDGITFYVRNEMMDKAFVIDWVGIWILGGLTVKEIQ